MLIDTLVLELGQTLVRAVTGKLLRDSQIVTLTSSVVGRHFSEWFPEPEAVRDSKARIDEARSHIAAAVQIVEGLRTDLDSQATELDDLQKQVDEKRRLAERYAAIAAVHRDATTALRQEIEETLRRELIAQSNEGKRVRQVASLALWVFTLVVGAAAGVYYPRVEAWAISLLG